MVALLQAKPQSVASAPVAAAPLPAILQPRDPNARPVDFSQVPADLLAEMDDEIAKMDLSPQDKQLARANLAGQYFKAKAVVEALNR